MRSSAVIGLGFGDEGKGVTVDFLSSQYKPSDKTLVVRFSGGHQAGHTVNYNNIRHIFSNFGSGTLRGASTYFSKFCTISPIGILKEYAVLVDKGITPKLMIDENCPIVTPYDQFDNQQSLVNKLHGTCGMGFGSTIAREENHYHLVAGDLLYPTIFDIKLNMIKNYYNTAIDLSDFYAGCEFIMASRNISIINAKVLNNSMAFDHIIYEGSQGLMLDKDIGFFPHVTRGNTGTKNLLELETNPEMYIVTRAYQTRHGNGEMTNEHIPNNIKINPLETNVTNKYQGIFKRSLLDLNMIQYALKKDGNIKHPILVITCLDHVENEYRFTWKNEIVNCIDETDFITKIGLYLQCSRMYINHSDSSETFIKRGWGW